MAKFDPDSVVWQKSTTSDTTHCVEVAFLEGTVLVRHSRHPSGPTLSFSLAEWAAFVAGVRRGELTPG